MSQKSSWGVGCWWVTSEHFPFLLCRFTLECHGDSSRARTKCPRRHSDTQVLPIAFMKLGAVLGGVLLVCVGILTWFTLAGLVYAAEKTGRSTYASVVRLACGRPAKWGLLFAVFANCFGMCVVFMVIFADILVGTGGFSAPMLHFNVVQPCTMQPPCI